MQSRGNMWSSIPPVTKNLLIINVIVWLAMLVLPQRLGLDVIKLGGLHYFKAPDFNPVQLVTYMFMHSTDTFAHLFFNMFTLWMFGITLERVMGSARFLFFYMTVGIGAGLFQELVWSFTWEGSFLKWVSLSTGAPMAAVQEAFKAGQLTEWQDFFLNHFNVTIGASGAIYGILLAFGMLFPNRPLYLMFIPVPIKAKWMVLGYGVIEILLGISGSDGVAHFAHLGGMIFGFILLYYWKKKGEVYGDPF
ncbi:MAG: rhomboid family intramembrane serine protease [Candidatus Amulumruptor caecigallinarius]|nr:rhomboid family intramembrane serine protease [Candidatus Amulumruptor caecigallinarius]MCM1453626.1 rhomboid family intramembrane serine protease [bacterium]